MKKIQLSYFDLSPELHNPFDDISHSIILDSLNVHFTSEHELFKKIGGFNLALMVCTKLGTEELAVKGPGRSKKYQVVEYTIFLPDKIRDLRQYVEFVIQGAAQAISKYGDFGHEIAQVEIECTQALNLE
jgi:hypothetical protein